MRSIPFLTLIVSVAITAACGELKDPQRFDGPAVATLDATVEGTLSIPTNGPARGALLWTTYQDELIECLADVPDFEGQLDYENEAHWPVLEKLQLCSILYSGAETESASVEISSEVPSTFELPLLDLPGGENLFGTDDARMGLASVAIYEDGNENAELDLAPPGTETWHDRVIGSSGRLHGRSRADYVVYREGALSPLWKLIRGIYGCTDEPPEGFSTLHLDVEEGEYGIVAADCVIDDAPVNVVVEDSLAMQSKVCESAPALDDYTPVEPGDVITPETWFQCEDDLTVYYTHQPEAVCPEFGRYDLIGCTDRTSEQSCAQTFFDDTENRPVWWPCDYLWINGIPGGGPATEGLDVLANFRLLSGVVSMTNLSVEAVLPSGEVSTALTISLDDVDGNGFANEGDSIVVSEGEDLFNSATPAGGYEIRLYVGDVLEESTYYYPVEVEVEGFEIEVVDALPNETAAFGTHFYIDILSGDETYPLESLSAHVAYSCEAGVNVTDSDFTLEDEDGDGLVGAGDRIAVRLPNTPDDFGLVFPTGYDCVYLYFHPGPNLSRTIGYGSWEIFHDFEVSLVEGEYTDGLDPILEVTINGYGELAAWSGELVANLYMYRNQQYLGSQGATIEYVDNGDGLINAGDTFTVVEREDWFGPDTDPVDLSFYVYLDGITITFDETFHTP